MKYIFYETLKNIILIVIILIVFNFFKEEKNNTLNKLLDLEHVFLLLLLSLIKAFYDYKKTKIK